MYCRCWWAELTSRHNENVLGASEVQGADKSAHPSTHSADRLGVMNSATMTACSPFTLSRQRLMDSSILSFHEGVWKSPPHPRPSRVAGVWLNESNSGCLSTDLRKVLIVKNKEDVFLSLRLRGLPNLQITLILFNLCWKTIIPQWIFSLRGVSHQQRKQSSYHKNIWWNKINLDDAICFWAL